MVESKIVKPIGNLDVPFKQKADGTLYTFDPAVSPAEGTTTNDGLAGGTTVRDTTRTEVNNYWNGMALLITSGAWNGQVREITAWVLATGTFTVAPAFGGQILAGVTYKILSNLPADIDVAAIEAKLDARLDVTISSRASAAALVTHDGKLDTVDSIVDDIKIETLTHPTLAEIEATAVLAKEATFTHATYGLDKIKTETALIKTQTDKMPRILCSMDFWGAVIEELQLTANLQANLALGGNVVIAGLPANITLVRVVVMFMCRSIENTNVAANKLLGAQNIEVDFEAANFIDAIALADDLFAVALSTREMGTVIVGAIDVKATVTGNGTCTFRIDAARADVANLNFNDYQVGVRVYFTV